MKTWIISDTHGLHKELKVPENIDTVIHCGDFSNSRDILSSLREIKSFIDWFYRLEIKYKILIAGNHDTFLQKRRYKPLITQNLREAGIYYLCNAGVQLNSLKIYGNPYTSVFNNGAFQTTENILSKLWNAVPADVDILLGHGMPKSVGDLCVGDRHVGNKSLKNNLLRRNIKYYFGGHIHDNVEHNITNFGEHVLPDCNTKIYNVSCMADGLYTTVKNNGVVIDFNVPCVDKPLERDRYDTATSVFSKAELYRKRRQLKSYEKFMYDKF